MSITKIMLFGKGGQGIKFAGDLLGRILTSGTDLNCTVESTFDGVIRGGFVSAHTIVSSSPILSPVIEVGDLAVVLAQIPEKIRSKVAIVSPQLSPEQLKMVVADSYFVLDQDFLQSVAGVQKNVGLLTTGIALNFIGMQINNSLKFDSGLSEKNCSIVEQGYKLKTSPLEVP